MDTQMFGDQGWAPPSAFSFRRNRGSGLNPAQLAAMQNQSQMTYQPTNDQRAAQQQAWNQQAANQYVASQQLLAQQQPVANLQAQYPIGGNLSPLAQQEATRLGMTPEAYIASQRVRGADRIAPDGSSWINPKMGKVDPMALLNHPQFSVSMQKDPQKAAQLFQSLSGMTLDQGQKMFAAQRAELAAKDKKDEDIAAEYFDKDIIKYDLDNPGKMLYRPMVADPMNPGKFIRGEYVPLDDKTDPTIGTIALAYQRRFPLSAEQMNRMAQEAAKRKKDKEQRDKIDIAGQQSPIDPQYEMRATPFAQTALSGLAGNIPFLGYDITKEKVLGRAPQSTAALRSPQMAELLKTNPEQAMKIILATRFPRQQQQEINPYPAFGEY